MSKHRFETEKFDVFSTVQVMSDLEYEQSALSHVQKYPSLKNRTPVKLVKNNDNSAAIVPVVCFI